MRKVKAIILVGLMVTSIFTVAGSATGDVNATLIVDGDADGDGDYATIQTAINAATAGDTIQVQQGTYEEKVVINRSVSLRAPNGAVLSGLDLSGTAISVTADESQLSGFTIRRFDTGINIDATGAKVENTSISLANKGVLVSSGETATLSGVRVEQTDDTGILFRGTNDVTVTDSTVIRSRDADDDGSFEDGHPDGIRIQNAADITLQNITTRSNEGNAIEISGKDTFGRTSTLKNITVRQLRSNSLAGIDIDNTPGSDSATLSNVSVTGSTGNPIQVAAENTDLTNVTVEDGSDSGILVTSTSEGTVDISDVTARNIRDSDDDGSFNDQAPDAIQIANGAQITVTDVSTRNTEGKVLAIEGDASFGRSVTVENVSGAQAKSNDGPSIRVDGTPGTDSLSLNGISITGSSGHAIESYAEETSVTNATISQVRDSAIYIEPTTTGSVTVTNVTLSGIRDSDDDGSYDDQAPDGIQVVGGIQVNITDVIGSNTEGQTVTVSGDGPDGRTVTIENVTADQGDSDKGPGIRIEETTGTDTVTIRETDVSSATSGLDLTAEQVTITNSTFSGGVDTGVEVSGANLVAINDSRVANYADSDDEGSWDDPAPDGIQITNTETVDIDSLAVVNNEDAGLVLNVNEGSLSNITAKENSVGIKFGTTVTGTTTVAESTFTGNTKHAIISDAGVTVNATNNIWSSGFTDSSCSGNVTCTASDETPATSPVDKIVGTDKKPDLLEVQNGISYWANSEIVDGTNERITLMEIQSIIQAWSQGTTI